MPKVSDGFLGNESSKVEILRVQQVVDYRSADVFGFVHLGIQSDLLVHLLQRTTMSSVPLLVFQWSLSLSTDMWTPLSDSNIGRPVGLLRAPASCGSAKYHHTARCILVRESALGVVDI